MAPRPGRRAGAAMSHPSPLIAETLVRAHGCLARTAGRCGLCSRQAQALADAGVLGPEQVREREAAVLHALADKWQWGAWADVLTKAGTGLMGKPQAVLDWIRAQADERGQR